MASSIESAIPAPESCIDRRTIRDAGMTRSNFSMTDATFALETVVDRRASGCRERTAMRSAGGLAEHDERIGSRE